MVVLGIRLRPPKIWALIQYTLRVAMCLSPDSIPVFSSQNTADLSDLCKTVPSLPMPEICLLCSGEMRHKGDDACVQSLWHCIAPMASRWPRMSCKTVSEPLAQCCSSNPFAEMLEVLARVMHLLAVLLEVEQGNKKLFNCSVCCLCSPVTLL